MHDPRALAAILEKAEADLKERAHPDPYRREFHPSTFRNLGLTNYLSTDRPGWDKMVSLHVSRNRL